MADGKRELSRDVGMTMSMSAIDLSGMRRDLGVRIAERPFVRFVDRGAVTAHGVRGSV